MYIDSMVKNSMLARTRNKARMSIHHFYLTLYSRSYLVQEGKKNKSCRLERKK